ncbi:hypothetical protein CMV30_12470 [Nibricoccus aquaticus]|uniref:Prepilin-type cleavage/methylation domain-containing protein n=1 Tax=Nibricoccus aquaticus TaxID=2576891 RepID=A0A290Q8Y9_9BACT|nr:prepilin-type N-terminal cleavage/methylation domain-containing protein [Nibricoccus aquaticus]ATC64707.1 hypothetical protein CMV30_12470 [Nibricoccus aquaticus]
MKLNRSKKGFTLVEIMIVVVIIGLLAAMAIPAFQKVRRNSIGKAMINDARQLGSALSQIATDFGAAPGETFPLDYVAASGLIDNNAPVVLLNTRTIPANELGKYVKVLSKNYTLSAVATFGAGETTVTRADDTAFTIQHAQVRPDELQGGVTSPVAGNNLATFTAVAFDIEGKLL